MNKLIDDIRKDKLIYSGKMTKRENRGAELDRASRAMDEARANLAALNNTMVITGDREMKKRELIIALAIGAKYISALKRKINVAH